MPRGRPRKTAVQQKKSSKEDISYTYRTRRSSLKVNLSYVSNISDATHESLKRTKSNNDDVIPEEPSAQNEEVPKKVKKTAKAKETATSDKDSTVATPASVANVTVIDTAKPTEETQQVTEEVQIHSISTIKEKEQQLNRSCSQLKDIIISKTKALYDKENALAIKISEVLSPGSSTPPETAKKVNDNRSPSVKVIIGKNDQIVMSGDGRKKNPVQVSTMSKGCSPPRELDDASSDDDMNSDRSIGSTPKKSRIDSSLDGNKSLTKNADTSVRIPVARLFAHNDPNNSMSKMEPVHSVNSLRSDDINNQSDQSNVSNASAATNRLNYSTSPILSQGTRRSRFSLTLKKKLTKPTTETSRLSTTIVNESFVNRVPLTCSSFIEIPDNNKAANVSETCKNSETVELDENSKSKSGCKTINLDDNSTKTINIENSTTMESSCMDITTVSSSMPIVRRSFQHIIRKSLGFDDMTMSQKELSISKQKLTVSSVIGQSKESSKHIGNLGLVQKTHHDILDQESCSGNTVKSSLNVNTSIHNVEQKENKKPNEQIQAQVCTNQVDEADDTVLIQNQSLTTVRTSMQVNTSLDSVRTLSDPTTITIQEQQTVIRVASQVNRTSLNKQKDNSNRISQQASNNNLEKESITATSRQSSTNSNENVEKEITSRQSSNGTVRTSMNVNTSLDSAKKSPANKNNLDFDKILSMVEESTSQNHSKSSSYSLRIQTTESEGEEENVSLIERIRNISATKKTDSVQNNSKSSAKKSTEGKNSFKSKRKSKDGDGNLSKSTKRNSINNKSNRSGKKNSIVRDDNTDSDSCKESDNEQDTSSTEKEKSTSIGISIVNNSTKSINAANTSTGKRKSDANSNINSSKKLADASANGSATSIVEATPYPASRSFLYKTMIRNNIAMNTIDPRRLMNVTDDDEEVDDEVDAINKKAASSPNKNRSVYASRRTPTPEISDTVVLSSSDGSSNELDNEGRKEPIVIDESVNVTKDCDKSKVNNDSHDQSSKKTQAKRKLYPMRDNSQLVSFSASETQSELSAVAEIPAVKKKSRRAKLLKKKKKPEKKKVVEEKKPESETSDHDLSENKDRPVRKKVEKKTKKPKKVKSKKIVVKKVNNLTMLDNLMEEEEQTQRLSERSSLREFDLDRAKRQREKNARKGSKFVIVVTGLTKEEKDLVKSVVKSLGSASLQTNVTPRTTHVISSGVRTINLLKGILRGCWLVTLEWALKSLEAEKWLCAEPFEMSHFSKAVQENRRDRHLFGKGYVPELFVTCGPIYVENGTTPPTAILKELIKIAGGRITEYPEEAKIAIGLEGLKEIWILDSITTGDIQPVDQYKMDL